MRVLYSHFFIINLKSRFQSSTFYKNISKITNVKIYSNCEEVTLYANGEKVETKKGDKVFNFNTDYTLWRGALEDAGVDLIAPANCSVYADNRLVSIFPREDVEFTIDTKGKTFVSVRDVKTICGKEKLQIKAKEIDFV